MPKTNKKDKIGDQKNLLINFIFLKVVVKRHDRVSALKCMRETDRVSICEPASCEHARLSDLNNGSAD